MAKDKKKDKDRDRLSALKSPGERGTAGSEGTASHGASEATGAESASAGQHHAATAHGRASTVDHSLPGSRPELMDLHRSARARRNAAALGSAAFRAAVDEIARIEVRIAAIDRAADPPLG